MQGLGQKDMDANAYIEELHKLSLKAKYHEEEPERVGTYLSGLKYRI